MAGESLLKRCEEGHVFDVAQHALCPTCGSPVAGRGQSAQAEAQPAAEAETPEAKPVDAAPAAAPSSESPPARRPNPLGGLRGVAIGGGALAVVLLAVAVLTMGEEEPAGPAESGRQEATQEGTKDEGSGPDVIVRQDEPKVEPPPADAFNPSTADPYGTWEMYTPVPGQAPMRHVFEVRPDGSYSIFAGPFSHSGSVTFTGRVYQLQSRTSAYQDGGAFHRPDPDTIVFEGRLGRSVWGRVQQPALFDLSDGTSRLPSGLPAALGRMTRSIQASWRADAIPVRFEVERTRHFAYELHASFISPQDRTGLAVVWGRYHSSEHAMGGVNWFDKPLPEAFVDLPTAYAALGAVGPVKRAMLGYFNRAGGGGNTYDRNAPPSWLISPEAGQGGLVEAAKR